MKGQNTKYRDKHKEVKNNCKPRGPEKKNQYQQVSDKYRKKIMKYREKQP